MKANENQSAARKALLLRGWEALCQPLVAIIFGLVVGAVVILACGQNPMEVYAELFEKSFIKPYYLFSTLTRATPIIICAMATGMSWRAGYINLGVEGQMVTGTLVATVVALFLPGPPLLVAVIAWIAGMAAGALYALLPSVLVWKFNVSMVITTLMLNYVAIEFAKFLAQGVYKDPASGYVATYAIHDSAMFNKLGGTSITWFFFIALLGFCVMYFVMRRSRLGYEITAIGKNPEFAEASGMKVSRKIIFMMVISGALSGLAGAGYLMSEKFRYTLDFSGSPGLGWDGMLIALLGGHNPVGILVAAIFYAALKTGSEYIGLFTNVPKEIVGVIQGILILMLSVKFINENVLRTRTRRFVRQNNAKGE